MINKLNLLILYTAFICISVNIYAQKNSKSDSLSLTNVIHEVIQSHPSVKEAEEALNEANTRIELARLSNYPDFDFTSSYTRLGPITSISFSGFGTFDLFPANNYSASVNYSQKLYDFGRKTLDVELAGQYRNLSGESIEQVKQKLALNTMNCFYSLVYLQEAIDIKNEQLNTLNEHLNYVNKKKSTGSATDYEILSVKVKITNIESQKMDLENALHVRWSSLNSLLGKSNKEISFVKKEINIPPPPINEDSLISFATENRDEMKILKEKNKLAEIKSKVVKAQNYPMLNIFASAGGKNGYIPDLNQLKANYVAGIGFKFPLYDAGRNKTNLVIAKSEVQKNSFEQEIALRNITDEIVENVSNITLSRKKIKQFELQLSQSAEALKLAKTNYNSGVITNLELLDVTTSLSESRLLLLRSQIDYIISIFKLNASIGKRLY